MAAYKFEFNILEYILIEMEEYYGTQAYIPALRLPKDESGDRTRPRHRASVPLLVYHHHWLWIHPLSFLGHLNTKYGSD